jgi:ABC-2 type transport system ATP-binding protein
MRKGLLALVAALPLAILGGPQSAGAFTTEDGLVATSFDGTKIIYTLHMPDGASASRPVPAILITHGFSGSRQKTPSRFSEQLLANGYAVLSWDQRGFGESGGWVQVDDPDFEARDVSALIDALTSDPRIAREAAGDPLIGMSGGSYAGGIQWVTAATDPRVDAIAPEIAWHNLLESLIPEGVVNTRWGRFLYRVPQTSVPGRLSSPKPAGARTDRHNPEVDEAKFEAAVTGDFDADTRAWFAHKGPDYLLDRVNVPTFIIQGTIDVLVPPSQGVANYEALRSDSPPPLKMAFYCFGHGRCAPFEAGPSGFIQNRILAWFDRYLKGLEVATGPRFEYITDDGVWHGAPDYPVPETGLRSATGSGTVAVTGARTISGPFDRSDAPTALEIPLPSEPGTLIGAPRIRLTESGVGTATDQPNAATLFFKIVNRTKDEVVGNQVTPKVLATDRSVHSYEFEIEPIAYTVDPGDRLVLKITGTGAGYQAYRGAAVVDLERVEIHIPELSGG